MRYGYARVLTDDQPGPEFSEPDARTERSFAGHASGRGEMEDRLDLAER
jgi:hypothetical protein